MVGRLDGWTGGLFVENIAQRPFAKSGIHRIRFMEHYRDADKRKNVELELQHLVSAECWSKIHGWAKHDP